MSSNLKLVETLLFVVGLLPAQQLQLGRGSGFLVTAQGHLITNEHVVRGCDAIEVFVKGSKYAASTKALDAQNDLALLLLDPAPGSFLGFRGQRIRLGESVVAMGFPLQGIGATSISVTGGTVSVLAGLNDDTRMIQFTAPIQPGNSGGPLVDSSGRLVGVVTSKLSPLWSAKSIGDIPQNVNFAIRDTVVRAFLDSRGIEYEMSPLAEMDLPALAERVEMSVARVDCSASTSERDERANVPPQNVKRRGVLVAGYGEPEDYFRAVFLEVQNILGSYGVQVANQPSAMREVSDDSISLPNMLDFVQRQGADSLLYMTVEHSGMNILRTRLRCFDPDGKLLWEETGSNARVWIGGKNSFVSATVKQLKQKLKSHAGAHGLPLR